MRLSERTTGTEFDIAVFTNLTQDHLDFHSSLQHLMPRPGCLGAERDEENNKAAVLTNDEHSIYIAEKQSPVITYGIEAMQIFERWI